MLIYPQLSTGTLAQFPAGRRRKARTALAVAPGGCTWKLADLAGHTTEWRLSYFDLSDDEAAALEDFFEAAEGSLRSFTFVDPIGNLLSRSGKLDHASWIKAPFLTMLEGLPDPNGLAEAWRLANSGAAPQSLTQNLAVPSSYVYCLSAYVRSFEPGTIRLLLGPHQVERETGATWRRITLANTGDSGDEPVRFGVEVPAGSELELFGLQVDAQPSASAYQASTTGGVYEKARLCEDTLILTATGLNRNSCTVNIIHGNHF